MDILDWRPYEREDSEGNAVTGAVCYLSEEDGIIPFTRMEFEARKLGLDMSTLSLCVTGEYLIADVESVRGSDLGAGTDVESVRGSDLGAGTDVESVRGSDLGAGADVESGKERIAYGTEDRVLKLSDVNNLVETARNSFSNGSDEYLDGFDEAINEVKVGMAKLSP